jgi:hypothetical protein
MKRTATIVVGIPEGWYLVPTLQIPTLCDIVLCWECPFYAERPSSSYPSNYKAWILRPDRRKAERRKEVK